VTSIVWIASYPKSGNTWVRFLACNLLFGPVSSAATVNDLAPDLHELRELPDSSGPLLLLKTHFLLTPKLPLVDHTAAVIYILREPADVMLSNFHYAQRSGASSAGHSDALDRYVDEYLRAGGDPRWTKAGMGTWEGNVRSWLAAEGRLPVLRLRYEDMLSDAVAVAAALCRFLGLSRTPAQIASAVEGASFQRMREIEQDDIRAQRVGIFYKPYLQSSIASGLRFMRAGESGSGVSALSSEQLRHFESVFGAVRREFGYS
jgi:hypothetical protein